MEALGIKQLLSYQLAFTKVPSDYKGEMATVLAHYNDDSFAKRRRVSKAWLKALVKKYDQNSDCIEKEIKRAVKMREEGNAFYSKKSGNKRSNLIMAGRGYSGAIFTAPEKTEALALAYANRAMVLQELEFYQQAYDDCCCALETNKYPQRLLHKVQTRQAFCALYLKDTKKLAAHLAELEGSNLNENFSQRVQELKTGLEALINEEKTKENKDEHEKENEIEVPNTEATEICTSALSIITQLENGQCITFFINEKKHETVIYEKILKKASECIKDANRGRYMIAAKPIKSGELIFSETLSSFVPVTYRMCEQCGSMLIIPIPCKGCYGRVIYCSLKCRNANRNLHQSECIGHRIDLFQQIGVAFLALRVMLEELGTILPLIANRTDLKELWLDLITPTRSLHTQHNLNYFKTLRMVTYVHTKPNSDIMCFALLADLLLVYLKEYTKFFNFVKDTKLTPIEWEQLTSALVMRHIGQFIVNAHTSTSIIPTSYDILSSKNNFSGMLLIPQLWTKPFHIRRGLLHVFCETTEVAYVNLPHLSICNHACAPTMRHKLSGRNFYALAENDIEKGAEIFNCYSNTYRNSLRDQRRSNLETTYHFKCNCVHCQRQDPDAEYLKHYLYKCQNPKCRKEFVPNVVTKKCLNWWIKEEKCSPVPLDAVTCTYCAKKQNFKWYQKFKILLKHITTSPEKLIEVFHIYEMVENILLGSHALKNAMGLDLTSTCIDAYAGGCDFTDGQINKVIKILKFCLNCTAVEYSLQSVEYVSVLTFMWDIIAMDKYKPTQIETAEMLKAVYILPDEYRSVFMNYYKEFIDPEY